MTEFENPWAPGGKYRNALQGNVLEKISGKVYNTSKDFTDSTEPVVYINNRSSRTVFYKPENGSDAIPIGPYSKSYEPCDGVATHKYCDQIYKVFTGVTIEIDEDGNVDPDYKGVGDMVNFIAGGWKDLKWLIERHNQVIDGIKVPDRGWDALFITSHKICKE